mmetsp:Transcript_110948/g.318759  ORF Transcript_110948/g.318759 Transcript_110948/m.318759 type:complete len:272 (-) Transcript_110948:51-866(-)
MPRWPRRHSPRHPRRRICRLPSARSARDLLGRQDGSVAHQQQGSCRVGATDAPGHPEGASPDDAAGGCAPARHRRAPWRPRLGAGEPPAWRVDAGRCGLRPRPRSGGRLGRRLRHAGRRPRPPLRGDQRHADRPRKPCLVGGPNTCRDAPRLQSRGTGRRDRPVRRGPLGRRRRRGAAPGSRAHKGPLVGHRVRFKVRFPRARRAALLVRRSQRGCCAPAYDRGGPRPRGENGRVPRHERSCPARAPAVAGRLGCAGAARGAFRWGFAAQF